jgi:hypothetical protein
MIHRLCRASAVLPAVLLGVAVFCVAVFLALPSVAQSAKRQTGLQRIATLEDGHAHSPDHEWARWVVTNFAPTRIHFPPWTDAERQAYLDEYAPDHIGEWGGPSLNRGDFCRLRGIASNTTHEYGSNEDLNELQGHTVPTLEVNGICRKESGKFPNGGWAGSYLMCHNAPKWHLLQKQSPQRQAVFGDSIFHDKFETTLSDLDQGYCDWCNRRFKEFMAERFNRRELAEMGFDLETFYLINYVRGKRETLSDEEMLEDPIIHEYIRFQFTNQLYWSVDVVKQYHAAAHKARKPIPAFYGNQSGMWGRSPFAVIQSNFVDIVWVEQSHCYQRPLDPDIQAFSTLLWKVGRAASHYEKAVWALEYQAGRGNAWPYGFGADKRYPTALANAEAIANGGVQCQTWVATPYNNQAISEALLDGHRHHAHFVDRHRGLFVDRTSVADHALIYSIPSFFWRNCYRLGLANSPCLDHFGATGRLLEDEHIPYNVVILGHEDVYDDTQDLDSLDQYKTLILPHADCISDRQAKAIVAWTRRGGTLVLWAAENVGTRDEELMPRAQTVFKNLVRNPGSGQVRVISTAQADAYLATGGPLRSTTIATTSGTAEVTRIERKVVEGFRVDTLAEAVADAAAPVLNTDLPETVWLNVWRHGAGPMMSVQMFNNDLDVEADTYAPVSNATLSLREPAGVTFAEVIYLNTSYNGDVPAKPQRLPLKRHGDYVTVNVPRLDMFGIVTFSVKHERQARMEAAHARKWHERLKIALRCPGTTAAAYDGLLSESKSLLDQIQGDAPASDFASLVKPLRRQKAALKTALNKLTAEATAARNAAENDMLRVAALRKFDFGESGAPSGWKPVAVDTSYTKAQGYGWTSTLHKTAVEHGDTNLVYRDFIRSQDPADVANDDQGNRHYPYTNPETHPGEFQVDLPNGEYLITLITGDYDEFRTESGGPANEGRTAMTRVEAEGESVLYGDRCWGGYFQTRAFRTKVTDGQLNLRFSGRAVGPFYCNPIEWIVNGLIIQTLDQTPLAAAQVYLDKAKRLSDAAIRDWRIIGPFDDSQWQGLETVFGPEKSTNVKKTYRGENTILKWQPAPRLTGSAPYVPLAELFDDTDEVAAFALSRVYCPNETAAVLVSSISQTGVLYVNGEQVLDDQLAVGLLPEEQYVEVNLKAGWNTVLIKTLNHWGKEWSVWAGLLTADGLPLADQPGVKVEVARK